MFWQSEKDEKRDEHIDKSITEIVEALSDKSVLYRFLRNCTVLNTIVWFVAVFFYEAANYYYLQIAGMSNEAGIGILLVPFFLGTFITYSLWRLKFPDIEDNNLQSGMMASYSYQSHSMKRWYIWFFSLVGGVANVILLCLVNVCLNEWL